MSLKKTILSVLLLSLLTAATAGYRWWNRQDRSSAPLRELPSAPEELQKIMQQYRRMADTAASVAATIRIYDLENKEVLKETSSFRYFRCPSGYYVRLSYLQTFCDGKWVVQLDTVNRQILVARSSNSPDGAALGWIGSSLQSLFSDTAGFRMTGTVTAAGKTRRLSLQSELNPEVRSATLLYDTLSYSLDKAEIEWWKPSMHLDDKGQKVWLAKIDYLYPPPEKIDIAARIRSIISVTGKQVTATTAYRDYQLNLNNNGL
jgi:hypothetical protein